MTPSEHYEAGNLAEAISAAQESVKKKPTDTAARGFLCEMLIFAGELEKADKQLDTIVKQEPESLPGCSLIRQLIRAEMARQQFFTEGRVPEFVGEVSPVLRLHLDASIALRDGNNSEAIDLLAKSEEQRPHASGTCDGAEFDDLRDLDDMTASFFEVLTSTGKYFWIATETIQSIEFNKPARPQDLIWRRVHMIVDDGPDGEVYLPALYAGTHSSDDDQMRLGRGTDWQGGDDTPVRGVGQKVFLFGEQDKAILELDSITFNK